MRTYKHEVLKQMREDGELDTQVYARIKADATAVKKSDNVPKPFPAKTAESINYPEKDFNKSGSLLYQTSSMSYGGIKPA